MTATVDDYIALVSPANVDRPKFRATIEAALEDIVADHNTVESLYTIFDLDTAVGEQLDVVGRWIGLSRDVPIPITGVYFSLDDADLGLDAGYLRGPFDPLDGLTELDDTLYRTMLRIKIAANHWDSTLAQAQSILAQVLSSSEATRLMVIDNFDMSISIGVAGKVPSAVLIALLQNYFTLIPAAVEIRSLTVTAVDGAPLFGLDCDNEYIAGLDEGSLGIIY